MTAPELQTGAVERRSGLPRAGAQRTVYELLAEPEARPGIAGTAYDTAWLAGLAAPGLPAEEATSRFPLALQWLVDNQQQDGSWGGSVRYQHDRVVCTLAALSSLAARGRRAVDRASVLAGTRYL